MSNQPIFTYPANDEDPYLGWYKDDFSSVFVATNPFRKVPEFPLNPQGEWVPTEVETFAKKRGHEIGVAWKEIADLCGIPSMSYVNGVLSLTGSKRIDKKFASPSDTAKMQRLCCKHNLFIPDEGCLSPLSELSMASFLKALEHDEVIVADHFGTSPRTMKSDEFLQPETFSTPEIHSDDRSIFVVIYTDYHYFLICQTEGSVLKANPADFFEGFFANDETNDFWGIGDLS